MQQHLRKYGWVYLLILVLIALPVWIIRFHWATAPIDQPTVRAYAEWVDAEMYKRLGPSIMDEWSALGSKYPVDDNEKNFRMLLDNPGMARSPLLKTEVDAVRTNLRPQLAEYGNLTSKGFAYFRLTDLWDKRPPDVSPTKYLQTNPPQYLAMQWRARAHQILGDAAVGAGDPGSALREYKEAAQSEDVVSKSSMIGNIIMLAVRNIGFSGMRKLFCFEPEAQFELNALHVLDELRTSPANGMHEAMLGESSFMVALMLDPGSSKDATRFLKGDAVSNGLGKILNRADQIKDPVLRAWAERFKRTNGNAFYIFNANGPRWTTIPSAIKFIDRALAEQPELLDIGNVKRSDLPHADPYTLLLLQAGGDSPAYKGFSEAVTRGRVTPTNAALLEAGFAARLHFAQRGAWPEQLSELMPDPLPANFPLNDREPTSEALIGSATTPFGPIHLEWMPLDEALRNVFLQAKLSLGPGFRGSFIVAGRTLLYQVPITPAQPDCSTMTLALADILRSHKKLVESVYFEVQDKSSGYWEHGGYDKSTSTFRTDLLESDSEGRGPHPESAPELGSQAKGKILNPTAIRLTVHLNFPDRVLTIWSPGPDGVDNRANNFYDPSNGSVSSGDQIVFPEPY